MLDFYRDLQTCFWSIILHVSYFFSLYRVYFSRLLNNSFQAAFDCLDDMFTSGYCSTSAYEAFMTSQVPSLERKMQNLCSFVEISSSSTPSDRVYTTSASSTTSEFIQSSEVTEFHSNGATSNCFNAYAVSFLVLFMTLLWDTRGRYLSRMYTFICD